MNPALLDVKTKERINNLLSRYSLNHQLYPEWVRIGMKVAKANGIHVYPVDTGLFYGNLKIYIEAGLNDSIEVGSSVRE